MQFKVLDCDGKLMGVGATAEAAIAAAAAKLAPLPWEGDPGALTAIEVVKNLISNGDLELELPSF